jgi:hypothetical protein
LSVITHRNSPFFMVVYTPILRPIDLQYRVQQTAG